MNANLICLFWVDPNNSNSSSELMPIFCPRCNSKFVNRDALNRHQPESKRCEKIFLQSILVRKANLKCSFGCYSKPFKNEASLLNHFKNHCAEIPNSQKLVLFPSLQNFVNPSDNDLKKTEEVFLPAKRILLTIGLEFYAQYGFLVCIECKAILGKNYLDHARRIHKRPILSLKQKNTVSLNIDDVIGSSPYFSKSGDLLEPIHFVEVFDGFRCCTCFYACKSVYSINEHLKKHTNEALMIPCKIQTIIAKIKIFFFKSIILF